MIEPRLTEQAEADLDALFGVYRDELPLSTVLDAYRNTTTVP